MEYEKAVILVRKNVVYVQYLLDGNVLKQKLYKGKPDIEKVKEELDPVQNFEINRKD